MQLVGRETELGATADAMNEVTSGSSCAVGIFGEAGIGKSALLVAMGDRAKAADMLALQ